MSSAKWAGGRSQGNKPVPFVVGNKPQPFLKQDTSQSSQNRPDKPRPVPFQNPTPAAGPPRAAPAPAAATSHPNKPKPFLTTPTTTTTSQPQGSLPSGGGYLNTTPVSQQGNQPLSFGGGTHLSRYSQQEMPKVDSRQLQDALARQAEKHQREMDTAKQMQQALSNELKLVKDRQSRGDQEAWKRRADAAEAHLARATAHTSKLEAEVEKLRSVPPTQAQPANPQAESTATTHLRALLGNRSVRPHLRTGEVPTLEAGGPEYDVQVVRVLQSEAQTHLSVLESATNIRAVLQQVVAHTGSVVSVYAECLSPMVRLHGVSGAVPSELLEAVSAAGTVLMALLRIEPPGVGGMHLSHAAFEPSAAAEYEDEAKELCMSRPAASRLVSSSNVPGCQQGWLVDESGVAEGGFMAFGEVRRAWDALRSCEDGMRATARDALCPARVACTRALGGVCGVLKRCIEKLAVSCKTRADVAAVLTHLLCKVVLPYDDILVHPLPGMSCGLLHEVSLLHLLIAPLRTEESVFLPSPPEAYRRLQSALFHLELSLLRSFPHIPHSVSQTTEELLLRHLYPMEERAERSFAHLRTAAVGHAASSFKRLQLVASRFEAGPHAAAYRASESLVKNSSTGSDLNKEALRISMNMLLFLQSVVQNEEYEELRSQVFAHSEEAGSTPPPTDNAPEDGAVTSPSRKRRAAGQESPRKRLRTEEGAVAVDNDTTATSTTETKGAAVGAERLAMVTFFRVAELAQNCVVLLKERAWRRRRGDIPTPADQATQRDLEATCVQCLITLHLILPYCTNLHDYSHVLSSPIALLLEYSLAPDFADVLKCCGASPPRVDEAVQKLAYVKATWL